MFSLCLYMYVAIQYMILDFVMRNHNAEYNSAKCGSVELFMDSRFTTFFHSYHIKCLDNLVASQVDLF